MVMTSEFLNYFDVYASGIFLKGAIMQVSALPEAVFRIIRNKSFLMPSAHDEYPAQ
jgi:hypothetical protein